MQSPCHIERMAQDQGLILLLNLEINETVRVSLQNLRLTLDSSDSPELAISGSCGWARHRAGSPARAGCKMAEWRFDLVEAPPPGTARRGTIAWPDPMLAGWDWPYVAVNGARPGPAVVVTAGYHGSEYASIDAVVRLGASLDPAQTAGQVLCLP